MEKNDENPLNDLGGNYENPKNEFDKNDENPLNEFFLTGHVDTVHELYLHGFSQSKSFFYHHFPQTPHNHSGDLPNDLKNQYQKIRRKMAIPKAMGKLKHQISKDINILNNTSGKTNW
jgi:hypothetical protein